MQLCVQPQQIPLLFSVASYLALKGTIFMSVLLNNRFLRERGMASTPQIEYQVFLCIFQKNSAMATLGLKEMGKLLWEGREKVCPVGCLSLAPKVAIAKLIGKMQEKSLVLLKVCCMPCLFSS